MLSITDGGSLARALSRSIDDRLKHLLTTRSAQLGNIEGQAHFIVAQPADQLSDIQQALGFSPLLNPIDGSRFGEPDFTPAWEWIADHSFCFELTFIFDDSGFAHVLFVEKAEGANLELLSLCAANFLSTSEAPAERIEQTPFS
ncbi:MAG TPA: hypothetical protein VEZ41_04380 [Allosphingosinicella sp.]|nr:hypothetical protein [Allosphingosinicella sp.]